MFGPRELDLRNVYNPNLRDIKESAERTYGEANSFYRKDELYLKDIEMRILSGELSSEKDIYDECNAIASDLAKCCEMYLKALYIFEHNTAGIQVETIWEKLKNSEFRTDENGNLIYVTSVGIITFAKYDENGNPIKDSSGKIIYFDNMGNTYNENNRGSKIKRNGHQLDRLIELLSPESRLLLETRMLTIPMSSTEKNPSVSILDILLEKGKISLEQQISSEQYMGWINQHKKTFEEARYGGQKHYDVNVEFLYHLATQIKAVAQYKIDPSKNQKFTITKEEIEKLPDEIKQLASFHFHLLSEELVKLIASNDEIKNKVINLFSSQYSLPTENITSQDFYNIIRMMNGEEITYISHLCYIIQNYDILNEGVSSQDDETKKAFEIAGILKAIGINSNNAIGIFIQIKEVLGEQETIGNESIGMLLTALGIEKNNNYKYINNSYYNANSKFDQEIEKYAYNNNYKYL